MSNEDAQMEGQEEQPLEENKEQSLTLKAGNLRWAILNLPQEFNARKQQAGDELLQLIKEKNMGPFYEAVAAAAGWMEDQQLVNTLKAANEAEEKKLDAAIEDAKTNAGESEVRECKLARANYFADIGHKDRALEAYEDTLKSTVGAGGRIDVVFAQTRVALMHDDIKLIKTYLDKAKGMVDSGGDWERRNLYGVYEATYLVMKREFKAAAKKFLDAIATFTCYDLYSYETFIFYAVMSTTMAMDRITLRDKVVRSPEVLSVINDVPNLNNYLTALFKCKYKDFFHALSAILPQLSQDRFFAPHVGYYLREVRIVAYNQFLTSYRSVTLDSMATAFGVTIPFLDRELSRFIAVGRISCKIDKVTGIVETSRADAKNAQYQQIIKQGDTLLSRMQKLARVITF